VTYRREDGTQQTLAINEVLARASEGELGPPFKILTKPPEADLRRPHGKLARVCLKPVRIHRRRPSRGACSSAAERGRRSTCSATSAS
jgi:hypothetical protein